MPFTQAGGQYGQLTAAGELSLGMARANARRLFELCDQAAGRGEPFDLLIGQMWDGYIHKGVLSEVRRRFGTLVVNVAMDDRHAFAVRKLGREIGTRGLAPVIDLAATAAPEAVGWYLQDGCPAIFFPEASDPNLFRPRPELPKRYEVSFVGACYGIRRRLVEHLRHAGVEVQARGSGWAGGRIATEDVPRLLSQSKIVLGVGTIGHSRKLLALKMRDFDGPMSGSCYLTHHNSDLEHLYRIGEEIVVYRDERDCVETVRDLLRDDKRREEIGRRGRERTVRDHTWGERFRLLLQVLRGGGG